MTDNQKVAYVVGEATVALIRALGMFSENLQKMQRNESLAYDEKAFEKLINSHPIHHNATVNLFHGG